MEAAEKEALAGDLMALERLVSAAPRSHPVTALVTGANSGIGFALAELLARAGVKVILACRNKERGLVALRRIQDRMGARARVELLLLDVADPASIHCAAVNLRHALGDGGHLDYVFLNAGIMPVSGYRWGVPLHALLRLNMGHFLTTGRAHAGGSHFIAQPEDELGVAGAPAVFATHVLGHLYLIQSLQSLLAPLSLGSAKSPSRSSRVIWTSSRAATVSKMLWGHLQPPAERSTGSSSAGDDVGFDGVGRSNNSSRSSSNSSSSSRSGHALWLQRVREEGARHGEAYGEAKYATDLLNVSEAKYATDLLSVSREYFGEHLSKLFIMASQHNFERTVV